MSTQSDTIKKARYWWAVLWTENLIDDWREKIADILQLPFVYCVHDMDTDTQSEHRKEHVHLIVAFPNTTTYKHALNIFKLLGKDAVNTCEACINIRHCYEYLIHNTESAQKANKHQYDNFARICGNNFDIGLYEQLSAADRRRMREELTRYIIEEPVYNFVDFMSFVLSLEETEYLDIAIGNNAYFEKLCTNNYYKITKQY